MKKYIYSIQWMLFLLNIFPLTWAQEQLAWNPNLETEEERLKLLVSLRSCYPILSKGNNSYQRDQSELMTEIAEVSKLLGPHAASLEFGPSQSFGVEYTHSQGDQVVYSPEALQKVHQELRTSYKRLLKTNCLDKETSLDFLKFSECLKANKKNKVTTLGQDFFKLWPFFRLHSQELEASVLTPDQNQLREIYAENRLQELELSLTQAPTQSSAAKQLYKVFKKKFVMKTLRDTLTPQEDGRKKSHFITLEEAPTILASYRGYLGDDCSMISIPHYTLIKGQKTYIVRRQRSDQGKVEGFVTVFPIKQDDRTIPYIGTINGPNLNEEDTLWILDLVAKEWGQSEIFVPNQSSYPNNFLFNTDPIMKTMAFSKAPEETVEFPEGWDQLEKWHDQAIDKGRAKQFINYYAKESFSQVRRISFPLNKGTLPVQFFRQQSQNRCLQESQSFATLQALPMLDKAKYMLNLFNDVKLKVAPDLKQQEQIAQLVGLSPRYFQLVRIFSKMLYLTNHKIAPISEIRDMIKEFGISIRDLIKEIESSENLFKGQLITDLVSQLYRAYPETLPVADWYQLIDDLQKETSDKIAQSLETKEVVIESTTDLQIYRTNLELEVLKADITHDQIQSHPQDDDDQNQKKIQLIWQKPMSLLENLTELRNKGTNSGFSRDHNQLVFISTVLMSKNLPLHLLAEIPHFISKLDDFKNILKYENRDSIHEIPPYPRPASHDHKMQILHFISKMFDSTCLFYLIPFLRDPDPEVQLLAMKILSEKKYTEEENDYSYQFAPINNLRHHFYEAVNSLLKGPQKKNFIPVLRNLIKVYPKSFQVWALQFQPLPSLNGPPNQLDQINQCPFSDSDFTDTDSDSDDD